MSVESAVEFARKAQSDAALGKRVAAAVKARAGSAAAEAFAALGREEGFDFTAGEAAEARERILQETAISDGELDKVAGGVCAGVEVVVASVTTFGSSGGPWISSDPSAQTDPSFILGNSGAPNTGSFNSGNANSGISGPDGGNPLG